MTAPSPEPPEGSFASDNAAGVCPEVMEALAAANRGPALAYGEDHWTDSAIDAVRDVVEAPVEVLFCWGGTGANVVGLATMLQPWQSVICTDTAHIVVDECGAPARFTGSTITPVRHVDGKLTPDAIEPFLHWLGTEHHPQPRVLSISQVSEMGTVYTADEIGALTDRAHANGMLVHLDGARIANAVAAGESTLAAMVRDTGVDVMTLGFTKNGAMFGEAVVYLQPEIGAHARFVRKQAGQLISKNRFAAVQISALLANDLWLHNARHANDAAQRLVDRVAMIPGVDLGLEAGGRPAANSVFPRLPGDRIADLQAWSFFWDWDLTQSMVRWMTSFATTDTDIERFASGLEAILAQP